MQGGLKPGPSQIIRNSTNVEQSSLDPEDSRMATPRKPKIHCPNCGVLAPAARLNWDELTDRLNWDELTEERIWGEGDDLDMGPHYWKGQPQIHYFRRVRRCSSCDELIRTAEVDERLVAELARLRIEVQELRERTERAAIAAKELQSLLAEDAL